MNNSVKYFNEVCIKKFLDFSADFADNPKDLASYVKNITDQLAKLGVMIIKETLEEFDSIIKNSSERKAKWYVDKTVEKNIITSLGSVDYNKTLYKDKKSGEYIYLLDEIMGISPHTRISEDAVERVLTEAVQTSYRRGGEIFCTDLSFLIQPALRTKKKLNTFT